MLDRLTPQLGRAAILLNTTAPDVVRWGSFTGVVHWGAHVKKSTDSANGAARPNQLDEIQAEPRWNRSLSRVLGKTRSRQRPSRSSRSGDRGRAYDECETLTTDSLMLAILDEMDAVVKDILKFCESPGKPDDQLPNIRSALRIGNGHAPDDAARRERRRLVIAEWVQSYLAMQDGAPFKTTKVISETIADKFSITPRTVKNHWTEFIAEFPEQGQWAKQIEEFARYRDDPKTQAAQRAAIEAEKLRQRQRLKWESELVSEPPSEPPEAHGSAKVSGFRANRLDLKRKPKR